MNFEGSDSCEIKKCSNFFEYEAFCCPQQEPDDEINTPKLAAVASGFVSNGNSVPRELRKARAYSSLKFRKDLSKCYVYIKIKNVKSSDIKRMHIHVGAPNVLGPIIVKFEALIDIAEELADGSMRITLTNKDIIRFTMGESSEKFPCCGPCDPVTVNGSLLESSTVAALDYLARNGLLYINFHTDAESFFGLMRGQYYAKDC